MNWSQEEIEEIQDRIIKGWEHGLTLDQIKEKWQEKDLDPVQFDHFIQDCDRIPQEFFEGISYDEYQQKKNLKSDQKRSIDALSSFDQLPDPVSDPNYFGSIIEEYLRIFGVFCKFQELIKQEDSDSLILKFKLSVQSDPVEIKPESIELRLKVGIGFVCRFQFVKSGFILIHSGDIDPDDNQDFQDWQKIKAYEIQCQSKGEKPLNSWIYQNIFGAEESQLKGRYLTEKWKPRLNQIRSKALLNGWE